MSQALERLWAQIAARWTTGEFVWLCVGLAAQSAFFLRFLWQWLASEKARKSVVPRPFWYASLAGGLLLLSYSVHRRNPVFTLSQAAGIFIYLRNIHLILADRKKTVLVTAAVLVAAALLVAVAGGMPGFMRHDATGQTPGTRTWGALGAGWVTFGMIGNVIFFMRFVIQWIVSERRGESVVPLSFWYVSVIGGTILLAYALNDRDVVLSLGQGVGLIVYLRNIMLSAGERGKAIAFGALVTLWSALLFLPGLELAGFWRSGEGRAAEVAREMHASGDYLVPRVNGTPSLTKPPLYHWLAAASCRVFGVNETGARFPSAAAAVLTAVLVYLLGRRMFGSTAGLLAGLMTTTSLEFALNARSARTDMVYTLFVVAAFAAFYSAFLREGRARRVMFVVFFACMGLAFMTKGPAGLFIPLASGLAFFALAGRKDEIRDIPWLWGGALFAAIVVPWHVAVSLRAGEAAARYYFWGQIANWAAGNSVGRSFWLLLASSLLYVPYFLIAFLPWSLFLPAAVVLAVRAVRSGQAKELALPLAWLAVGVAAFAFSGTKAVRYLTPLTPATALVTAWFWRETLQPGASSVAATRAGRWVRFSAWPMGLACTVIAAAVAWPDGTVRMLGASGIAGRLNAADGEGVRLWMEFLQRHSAASACGAALFALVAAWGIYQAWRGRRLRYFAALAIVQTAVLAFFSFSLVPRFDEACGARPFAARVDALSGGNSCGWVGNASLEVLFYMGRNCDVVKPEDARGYIERDTRAVLIVPVEDVQSIPPEQLGFLKEYSRGRIRHRDIFVFGSPWRPPDATPVGRASDPAPQR